MPTRKEQIATAAKFAWNMIFGDKNPGNSPWTTVSNARWNAMVKQILTNGEPK